MLERLTNGARAMGIEMTPAQAAKFEQFHAMLIKANSEMNLTRVPDDPDEAVDRNYLDSLAPVAAGLTNGIATLADVGSGAGFPGIPLAIMLPETRITLLDALGKCVKFLQDAIDALGLNARAVHARAEDAGRRPDLRSAFDAVTTRAVSQLNVISELSLPLLRTGGTMLAYKGPAWQEELAGAENALQKLGGTFREARQVDIPGRDWAHCLVIIEKTSPTPDAYPRRPGVPEKKPL